MNELTSERVLAALRQIRHPHRGDDVVSLGMISGVAIKNGNVGFAIEVHPAEAKALEPLRKAAEQVVRAIPGVLSCAAVLTAERAPGGRPGAGPAPSLGAQQRPAPPTLVPGVRAVVAVASGKGGVGKSTTAVNLAMGLAAIGQRVGLLDADIYGPNTPMMLGVSYKPVQADGKIIPARAHGIELFSMGFLVRSDQPIIWRGPMLDKAIRQFLTDVAWGDLDYLIVDMPPGTGDAQLVVSQAMAVAGAVIVTLPQEVSQADARRGLEGFRQMEVPVLGVVENMSYLVLPDGTRMDVFGQGGGRKLAEAAGVPFIGEIPMDPQVRVGGDSGTPVVVTHADSPVAQALFAVARDVAAKVSVANFMNQNNVIPITEVS